LRVEPPALPPMYARQFAAICDPARIVIIEASTKSGKTAGCLLWLFAQAWNAPRGGAYWWIAPTFHVTKTVGYMRLRAMLTEADPRQLTWTPHDAELAVSLANGARIWFRSADNHDSLFGDDVSAAVIDEATRCPEAAWNAVRSTLTATRGPVRIIGNVKGRKNWVWRLARLAEAGTVGMAYHRLTAYDAVAGGILPAEEIEEARAVLPEHVFRELYLAEPADDGSNPFGTDAIARCVADLSPGPAVAYGVDLAKSSDWTAVVGVDAAGRVAVLERWQSDWGATRERVARIVGNCTAYVDSTGVGDPIVEDVARVCRGVEGWKFSNTSKQQLMEGLASAIQTGEVAYPDGWLRRELDAFGYRYTNGRVTYAAESGHDDGVCALALALAARRRHRPFVLKVI